MLKKSNRKTKEEKQKLVDLMGVYTVRSICETHNISPNSLYKWKEELEKGK